MYNIDIKQRFIDENYDNEGTRTGIKLTFDKIEILEEQYQTDLYEFNRNQILECFGILACTTSASLDKEWSKIKRYIEWSASEGYCPPNLAVGSIYKKDMVKYINKHAHNNMYISNREVFYEKINLLNNAQDQVVPVLLYEGICGRPQQENSFEEIKNLKKIDCDYDRHSLVIRRNDGTVRILDDIDMRSMDIIFDAIAQKEYLKGNGYSDAKVKTLQLQETEYVVRVSKRKDNVADLSTMVIDSRIRNFQKFADLKWVNAKRILFSGMFDRLQNREVDKELKPEDYKEVSKRFGWEEKRWYLLKEKYEEFKKTLQDNK